MQSADSTDKPSGRKISKPLLPRTPSLLLVIHDGHVSLCVNVFARQINSKHTAHTALRSNSVPAMVTTVLRGVLDRKNSALATVGAKLSHRLMMSYFCPSAQATLEVQ